MVRVTVGWAAESYPGYVLPSVCLMVTIFVAFAALADISTLLSGILVFLVFFNAKVYY